MDELCNQLPFNVGGYHFIRKIGRGCYSQCFEVTSDRYQQNFCAKVTMISDDIIDDDGNIADMEIYALTSLDDPNIIRIYDIFVSGSFLFLILELCQNQTIADYINEKKSINLKPILKGISHAVCTCHKANIAHRDIKPQNIFLDKYGRPKLADFGLSSLHNKKEHVSSVCGSKNYLAHEALKNETYDPFMADIWSLGVTFYEIVTGKLPSINDILHNELQFPENTDINLINLIKRMLAFRPNDRPTIFEICHSVYFYDNINKPRRSFMNSKKYKTFNKSCTEIHGLRKFGVYQNNISPSSLGSLTVSHSIDAIIKYKSMDCQSS